MSRDARFALEERTFCRSILVSLLCVFFGVGFVALEAVGAAELNVHRPSSLSGGRAPMSRVSLSATRTHRFETANFVIENAPTEEMAREFGTTAENCRRELAVLWIGQEMPNWSAKCPIRVKVGSLRAAGDTTFTFNRGEVYGWKMNVQGTRERINDSVLPHEISHMIFASYFRRPLPRWLDEGAATNVEHVSERMNYRRMLLEFVDPNVRRAIPFNRMVEMQEYPDDYLPLYSQCNSVAEFLIGQAGHRQYVAFAKDGLENGDWNAAVRKHYGYENLGDLQLVWIHWVANEFPPVSNYEPALARARKVQQSESGSQPEPLYAAASSLEHSSYNVASHSQEARAKDPSFPPQVSEEPQWQSPQPKITNQVSSQPLPEYNAPKDANSRYGGKADYFEPTTVGLRR